MILTKFDPPVKIPRVKSGNLKGQRVISRSNGHPGVKYVYFIYYNNV
jgi:hypothetical protein